MSEIGYELLGLHLLESHLLDNPKTNFIGQIGTRIDTINYDGNVIWLNRLRTAGFKEVSQSIWNFHIGGYQVCEKWLKDRRGKQLTHEEITLYQKILVAIRETIRLMAEIDEVIEQHGGWPIQ